MGTRATRIALVGWTTLVVLFLWIPLVLIGVYAFNSSVIQSWPIPGWTFHWFRVAWNDPDVRGALKLSAEVGLVATASAVLLGSMAAFATVPLMIMAVYLVIARRLGAFEAL